MGMRQTALLLDMAQSQADQPRKMCARFSSFVASWMSCFTCPSTPTVRASRAVSLECEHGTKRRQKNEDKEQSSQQSWCNVNANSRISPLSRPSSLSLISFRTMSASAQSSSSSFSTGAVLCLALSLAPCCGNHREQNWRQKIAEMELRMCC